MAIAGSLIYNVKANAGHFIKNMKKATNQKKRFKNEAKRTQTAVPKRMCRRNDSRGRLDRLQKRRGPTDRHSATHDNGPCFTTVLEDLIMRPRLVPAALAAFGCVFLWLTASAWLPVWADEEVVTLAVPAKEAPVPTTVSPELQKLIARPVTPRIPAPKTADAWHAVQRTRDAAGAKSARATAKALGATIETTKVGGVRCYRVTPKQVAAEHGKRLLVHLHGGAYVFNGGEAATGEALLVAHACKTRVLSVDYRMPPDHPFPAALDDAVAVWRA